MKVLGYIDDWVTWFTNWQISIGWWNTLVIPIEVLLLWIIYMSAKRCFVGVEL